MPIELHNRDTSPSDTDADPVRRAFRLELSAGLLTAGTLAVLEMGPALAKKAYDATDFEVALLTSGQSLGLILSFFTSHLASRRARVPLVFWLQLCADLCLALVFFVRPSFALGFVVLHALARITWSMSIPARILVYRSNFPSERRGQVVGRLRQLQLYVTTVSALLLSVLLDWSGGTDDLVGLLGEWPFGDEMVRYLIPAFAAVSLVGSFVYRTLHEQPDGGAEVVGKAEGVTASEQSAPAHSTLETLRSFWRVWRDDRPFRRYERFFFLFGFANIMTIPLIQIHAVDNLDASYFDLAMVNVILVQGIMGASMVFWGRRVDLYSPVALRGFLNLIFSIDLLFLFLAPTIGWVYVGRVFRGLAMGGGTLIWMLGPLWFAGKSQDAPVYTGIHAVLTGLRWAVAPFAGILLKNWFGSDSRPVFLVCCLVLFLTGVAMLLEGREK